ncbi:MAG: c-type cytochrome [Rhodoferax sp.]
MAKRIPVALAAVVVSLFVSFSAQGQVLKSHAPSTVDLDARLKEVEANPRQFEASYKAGAKVAAFCANCHGDGGNSVKPDIPNLAGQNPSYLLEQLHQFADGRRRNDFMERLIRALNPEEKIGMVVFYAKQEVVHKPVADTALVNKGKEYYGKICFRCHGEDGRGNEKIARIAGQQVNYLNLTLKRYRDGSSIRQDALMAANTRQMSDADIAAVVAYVSSMK